MKTYFERRYQELQSWIEGPFCGWSIWSNLYQLSDRMVDRVPGGCPPLIWRSGEIIFLRIIKQPDMAGLFFLQQGRQRILSPKINAR